MSPMSSGTAIKRGPYPTPSIHPPLRLLTTATCLDTLTTLVSAQSPPHSPTFSSFALPKSSSGSTSSRSNSILDGIQSALGGSPSSSSPPHPSNILKSSSSTYSAAKESLADFSIAPSKRAPTNNDTTGHTRPGGVVRSRSNYVSFPNFDEVDFVDVAMVDDLDEDDDDEHQDWSGPDSPPEGQGPLLMDGTLDHSVLDEKIMRADVQNQGLIGGTGGGGRRGPRPGLRMPTSPSQHWLLQLETYQERV
ncbi:hypothetical protein BG011_004179 [Mortierella polycephala]|uniref:Uncharacterized protein n=1 Tax=Mortierella polycephala TaxID=41804 RepID=A0A9P6Q0Y3_9FUNG|nr:hypothetical protein BG011_004179 [Mortierella polycephala]